MIFKKLLPPIHTVVDRLFYHPVGQHFVAVLFGFALATLFQRVCKDKCIVFESPPLADLRDKVFKANDGCYTYEPVIVKC